jgi:hypothetical protein
MNIINALIEEAKMASPMNKTKGEKAIVLLPDQLERLLQAARENPAAVKIKGNQVSVTYSYTWDGDKQLFIAPVHIDSALAAAEIVEAMEDPAKEIHETKDALIGWALFNAYSDDQNPTFTAVFALRQEHGGKVTPTYHILRGIETWHSRVENDGFSYRDGQQEDMVSTKWETRAEFEKRAKETLRKWTEEYRHEA